MIRKYNLLVLLLFLLAGCKKFLQEKPDKSLAVPSTVADLQALLDNHSVMNNYGRGLAEICSDNYYLTETDWAGLSLEGDRQAYIWGDEYFFEQTPNEWFNYYRTVYTANVVLEHIENTGRTGQNAPAWDNVKGAALFYRAFSFHNTAITWAKTFDSSTAATDPGIPLRLSSDFNQRSTRASVAETYARIIADLEQAVPLLPVLPRHVMRPSRPAAYALLARVYLSMRRYREAEKYADSCLQLYNTLINYNTLQASANNPLVQFNAEVIFHAIGSSSPLLNTRAKIDSVLYASYEPNDLRKTVFFRNNGNGTFGFKGNYSGNTSQFFGLATNEVWLIKAECQARNGLTTDAVNTLNTLLQNRWKAGTFVPLTPADPSTALDLVKLERRKELLMRNLRWIDIKRWNKEGDNIVLKRILGSKQYTLLPNDNKFALPLPIYIINNTGMQQNPG